MNIRKYMAFLRSIELGSISLAAQELGYTQSAISKMIADLEEEWNVKLITRNHYGIEISSEGMNLLPMVREIVKQYNELNFAVSEMHGIRSGILRLGCFTSFSTSMLPEIIKNFHEKYPAIEIQLRIGEYNEISRWLQDGKIDCGILSMDMKDEVDMRFLFRDSLVAVLPADHPMRNTEIFPLALLTQENFIILKETEDLEMSSFLERYGIQPAHTYEVNSDFTLLSMVECGIGISIVHGIILHPARFNVVKKPLDKTPYFDVGIGTKKGSRPSTIAKLFTDYLYENRETVL